ncbi:hypothetical protein BC938DRAFT_474525 [Jimgerdemannia flammicorona]|uniref:DUF1754-domain-containing protein n=1 Tax=Jimgerdemannia flammicorona TaxID=994334 RepID=A0A433Q209_9FUNG|nr:hypothetical protein BC938DRAFT_474525 [Jimgerdemannia flammicorona]
MSAYENVTGGSLKLKGEDSSIKKKKKKSKKDKEKLSAAFQSALREETGSGSDSGSSKPIRVVTKTAAELKFEETRRKRQEEKVKKAATKSHKEKVAEFNQKLEEMTEHYDIPKVGPG